MTGLDLESVRAQFQALIGDAKINRTLTGAVESFDESLRNAERQAELVVFERDRQRRERDIRAQHDAADAEKLAERQRECDDLAQRAAAARRAKGGKK
jgi:hypothetical protein